MRPGRCTIGLLLAASIAVAPALAVTGKVTDTRGRPIAEAKVCHFQEEINIEPVCGVTNAAGEFDLPDSTHLSLRIHAEGYFPRTIAARGHHEIVLEASPTLLVRLVDAASGAPLERGEVFVVYPSAKRKGPFPTNRNGVRIARVLQPGEVRLIAQAEGYDKSDAVAVKLERGKESQVEIRLSRAAEPAD